jgi:hypothetical protein
VSLRRRIWLASCLLILIPLLLLFLLVRREASQRLGVQHQQRVETLLQLSEDGLRRRAGELSRQLDALGRSMAADARLRLALVDEAAGERPYLIDYAARQMRLLGLDALQIHDAAGRVLSCGHHRNAFDRMDPRLVITATPSTAWIRACPRLWQAGNSRWRISRDRARPSSCWPAAIPCAWAGGASSSWRAGAWTAPSSWTWLPVESRA